MASSTASRFLLPGLNLPLNWTPRKSYPQTTFTNGKFVSTFVPAQGSGTDLLPTALAAGSDRYWFPMVTLRELTMLDIMNSLTDKLCWEEKVFDDTITEKWKAEALAANGRDVSQRMVNWVIEELRYKARIFKNVGAVSVIGADVVKSDTALPTAVKESLRDLVLELENVREIYKDYHPGSDGQVLDLVHPSLFPLIYGRSRVLKDTLIGIEDCIENCGKGLVIPIRPDDETTFVPKYTSYGRGLGGEVAPYSKNFQWLPSEVEFNEGGTAKFSSYINNLHPQRHKDLYAAIEQVLNIAIPLWDMTLTPLKATHWRFKRIRYTDVKYDPDPENMPQEDLPPREEDEDDEEFHDRIRRLVLPEPEDFRPPTVPDDLKEPGTNNFNPLKAVNLKRDYGHSGLQVIVKLANIELSPEKPVYQGGSWHVEGKLNEHICATALYYYDNENITPSRLAFRQKCSFDIMDVNYPQDHHDWLREVFGCEQDGPQVQEVGSVLCSEGRLLTFPNTLQHRVEPFGLADVTKKGHRKILALFLVDPAIKIISTANVPPQRRDWWSEGVIKSFANSGKAIGALSAELKEQVFEAVDEFPIGMDEAKEIRLKVMEERKNYVAYHVKSFEQETFSLCEH